MSFFDFHRGVAQRRRMQAPPSAPTEVSGLRFSRGFWLVAVAGPAITVTWSCAVVGALSYVVLPALVAAGYWVALPLAFLLIHKRRFATCVGLSLVATLAALWGLALDVHIIAGENGRPWWWFPYLINANVVAIAAPLVIVLSSAQKLSAHFGRTKKKTGAHSSE